MASEIRVNTINNSSGLGTITISDTGAVFTGVTTIASLEVTGSLVGVANTAIINTQSVNVSGVVTATSFSGESVNVSGVVTATSFSGDGSALTGLSSDAISEGNTSAEVVDTGSDGHFKVITEGSEQLRVDNSGRLIVGATSESESSLLSITGSTGGSGDTASIFLRNGLADGSVAGSYALGRVRFGNAGGECARIDTQSEDSFSASSRPGRLMFLTTASGSTTPTERMRIDSNGLTKFSSKSGSTSSPDTISMGISYSDTAGTNTKIRTYDDGSGNYNGIGHSASSFDISVGVNGHRMAFYTNSGSGATERMRIAPDGRILYGTTNSINDCRINLKGDFGTNRGVAIETNQSSADMVFFRTSSGNAGIIASSGTSTSYGTSSDYRLKENITTVTDGITRLQQLQPKRFNFLADPNKTVDGFIAHEVQTVVPEAITGEKDGIEVWKEGQELPDGVSVGDNKLDEDGNTIPVYQCIDQSKLVPLLTAALQEAIGKIETLETEKADILARLDAAGI